MSGAYQSVNDDDPNRSWQLASARGDIRTDAALVQVRAMHEFYDSWKDKDPELANALRWGDNKYPDDDRWPKPDDQPPIEYDPATTAVFEQLAAQLPPADPRYADGHPARRRGEPGHQGALADGHRATDVGNADRLAAIANGRIRYVHAWGKWIVYADGVWQIDTGDALVTEAAKQVAREMFLTAAGLERIDREPMLAWARSSERASSLRAMIGLARGIPGVLVDHCDLDKQPWLLNVANGTIDLRTGALGPHDPEHLLTVQSPVIYDPTATAPTWDACLQTWQPDPEMRGFLQRAIGSAATGHPVEHLFVNVGPGGNGKSKCLGAIQQVLGPYAVVPDKSLFVLTRHEPHPTVVASLFGARLLLAPETEAGDRLAEAQIKDLTGGDRMKARRMYENEWHFWPTWTAFMHTNHRPQVRGTDEGVWRRLRLIDWTVTIPEADRDTQLADKLAMEAPGILNWILKGAIDWQARGLDEPAQVLAATDAYRADSDLTARFLDEADLTLDPNAWMASTDLMLAHEKWCDDTGLRHPEQWQLTSAGLKRAGATPRKKGGQRGWDGLRAAT